MRDPKRIAEILALINQVWSKYPDLRFQQLMYNLQSGFSKENNNLGRVVEAEKDGFEKIGFDMFNVEDAQFMNYLKEVANK